MQEYHSGKNVYFGFPDSEPDFLERHLEFLIQSFLRRKLFRTLIKSYGDVSGFEGYVVLETHGCHFENVWLYGDGRIAKTIQSFIDALDGKLLAILLFCCNPQNFEIQAEKSIVIHSDTELSLCSITRGGHLRLYLPEKGYLDTPYKLRRTRKELSDLGRIKNLEKFRQ